MTTAIIFHEVQDGAVWAKAWKKGPGSRHEMFGAPLSIRSATAIGVINAAAVRFRHADRHFRINAAPMPRLFRHIRPFSAACRPLSLRSRRSGA